MELQTQFDKLMLVSPITQADVTLLLREMRRTTSGTLVLAKLLAGKIQSPSEAQAIHTFDILEACLNSETEGSIEFRTEVGRYRFLNDIIRILSPKYMGNTTSPGVKERAIKFLEDAAGPKKSRWFPSEHSKILSVYKSLVDGGVIKRPSPSTEMDEEAELQKSIFDRSENSAVLRKLLQSKDPADLQAANRLIKNLVDEETKRVERRAELHSLLDRIDASTSLLTEMLSQTQIDREIADELADTCHTLRKKLGGVATETNDETVALLNASEHLEKALVLYEEKKAHIESHETASCSASAAIASNRGTDKVMPGEAVNESERKPSMSLADELLLQLDLGTEPSMPSSISDHRKPSLDDIGGDLVNFDVDLPCKSVSLHAETQKETNSLNVFEELDQLSRQLVDPSLCSPSPNAALSEFRKSDKTPLCKMTTSGNNDHKQTSSKRTRENSHEGHENLSLLDFDTLDSNKMSNGVSAIYKDMEALKNVEGCTKLQVQNDLPEAPSVQYQVAAREFLRITKDINLDKIDLKLLDPPLDICITDSAVPKNVSLSLTFATVPDFPACVKLAIITVVNKNTNATLNNYVFQLIPPKGIQVKLLAPASMEIPPWKMKFLPPPLLTQLALVLVPQQQTIVCDPKLKLNFILSYTLEDDTSLYNGEFEIPSSLLFDIDTTS